MSRSLPLIDPVTGGVLCTCGEYYEPPEAYLRARQCEARHSTPPVIPGDALMRPAAYRPGVPTVYAARSSSTRRHTLITAVGLVMFAAALVVLLGLFASAMSARPGPTPVFVVPSTTPTPCSAGGVQCYWGSK